MNEPEKSDKPVVPMKPANSGASPSFWKLLEQLEQVEGRGLAKENEDHVGNETDVIFQAGPAKQADRTQSRLEESVITLDEGLPSALDRVRQAESRLAVISKARALCGSSARRDPCGGRRETAVPTATLINNE